MNQKISPGMPTERWGVPYEWKSRLLIALCKFITMPFYKIIVALKNSPLVSGIKELPESNIERAWQLMEAKAKEFYKGEFKGFDLVMISKRSDIYKQWLAKRNEKMNKSDTFPPMDDMASKDLPAENFGHASHRDKSKDKPPEPPTWWKKKEQ